ncbi:UV-damage endonuclease [Halobacillus karajensis]|uniref:UV DNA damage endonuclease n=1 Tax=Halobacillus karajensis TaxID=195088 RepID=A0A024P9H6_9BACI|nr:UV DNA damage repair endonuclease UvsE [Halobacillus karajensis]CDQ21441.1 UV DNA damage endonuclease [Halobacillus karajensis]CDQ25376.1 UV DNA damage endonuclease [Halobacillus karajensis]CDQ29700.1 UV DNA damage endonuclease [Halobacillus karajensis]SEI07656.1 UV-damage endonuclease [Halobacillus karajensis]
MIIRFGYVSHAQNLWEATPAKTMTFTRYQQLGHEAAMDQLHRITEMNLKRTLRIIHYNIAHEIKLYRFSSSIIPLATHDKVEWDYIEPFRHLYEEIGRLVQKHKMRTSFHPNQFTLFTSDRSHVTDNAIQDMEYHYAVLKAMGLYQESHINLHVGGAYGDKKAAVERFHKNIKKLPKRIKKQMTLENDDKTYTALETLNICQKEDIPMMFDYHHYMANHTENESLEGVLPPVFHTWDGVGMPPKIHISSPKSDKDFRSHADYVDPNFIRPLLKKLKELGTPVDFMIEAKEKDRALLKVVENFAKFRGVKRVGEATLEL